ncbi:MAG: P1 family peptidase [Opitutaceae bacterium]|nr:P1 family peptidase [Opitutaceae bacterium]
MNRGLGRVASFVALVLLPATLPAGPRARDLGVPFDGRPGPLNAITDVTGVEVGHTTLIRGEGALVVGQGPVRTGVTAILPRGRDDRAPVFAGWHALNGNGEMTGTAWIDESGILDGPIMLTNTHSVGIVRDAVIQWQVRHRRSPGEVWWSLPVVAETWDGWLNDLNGFHVRPEHAFAALDSARGGPVAEGSVGGGTGMICHEFKGGIGTASRLTPAGYVVGVLVQANYGLRGQLRIAGVPVGREIPEGRIRDEEAGSLLVIIATDAPLGPHQLRRLARRPTLALGRLGSISGDGSGDLFLAFSTGNAVPTQAGQPGTVRMLPTGDLSPLFAAVVEATEEAIVNALVAAETMTGRDGHTALALPHDRLRAILARHGRLEQR